MILKAEIIAEILAAKSASDPLVITPQPDLNELKMSGAASVDMRLGTWFLSLRQARQSVLEVSESSLAHSTDSRLTKMSYIPFGKDFILHPRSFVLGVTLEWIRIPRDLAGYVVGKSSLGRRGLIIATATGFHPGFTGCLTLELSNVGEIPIAIKPGMKICQLFFHKVNTNEDYVDCSRFIGLRKPYLGKVQLDEFAQRLSTPYY